MVVYPLLAQQVVIGNIYEIESTILEETRSYSVYLPPSYGENLLKTYPVIYLMDGDYNFIYVSGLVEQLSAIGRKIPEMIVIGLSDKSRADYVNDCTPMDKKLSPEGRSDKFLEFLTAELKPRIDSLYLTSPCDFLVGQSLGGLFVINTLMSQPLSFQNYMAISPSLWWNDFDASKRVPDFFEAHENLERTLFLSLGNEKGMGVLGFANELDVSEFSDTFLKKTPMGLDFVFHQYPNENHNSVGLISISDGLKWVFEGYSFGEEEWGEIMGFEEYISAIAQMQKMIGIGYTIPEDHLAIFASEAAAEGPEAIAAIQGFLDEAIPASSADFQRLLAVAYLNIEEPDEAILALRISININPNSSEAYSEMAKCFLVKNDIQKARHYFQQAIDKAITHNARLWYINQLEADLAQLSE
jgi:predicted alpha/beta superfamily hydrolase